MELEVINIATGDENADWIKLADPEAAKEDQIACDLALEIYKRRQELKMAERIRNRPCSDLSESPSARKGIKT